MALQVFRKKQAPAAGKASTPAPDALVGKTVFFKSPEGLRMAGLVERKSEGSAYEVRLAIPNDDGVLMVTDSVELLEAGNLEAFRGVSAPAKIKRFDALASLVEAELKMRVVQEEEDKTRICDYLDISFEGFASTFAGTTPEDRDGDYIIPGAFDNTITQFMRNPVMLIDHQNSVKEIAGSYVKMGVNKQGLSVRGKVSNSPNIRHARFLLAEGHLRALSIGGMFFYEDDGRGIREVNLYEISLVAVPANPDALFTVRSISLDDMTKAYKYAGRKHSLNFRTA